MTIVEWFVISVTSLLTAAMLFYIVHSTIEQDLFALKSCKSFKLSIITRVFIKNKMLLDIVKNDKTGIKCIPYPSKKVTQLHNMLWKI